MALQIEGGRPLVGVAEVPADKAMLHRALALGALAEGESTIVAASAGARGDALARALAALGVRLEETAEGWSISGRGPEAFSAGGAPIDCGESASSIHLLAGLAAGAGVAVELTGDASLKRRPLGALCEQLRHLGADVRGSVRDGQESAPLLIAKRPWRGGGVQLRHADALVKSSLLLAGAASRCAVSVCEPTASADHTERMLATWGAVLTRKRGKSGAISVELGAGTHLRPRQVRVPGDFSTAAFLLAGGLLVPGSRLTVENVGVNPTRTGFLEILEELGARTTITNWREEQAEPLASISVEPGVLRATRAWGAPLRIDGATLLLLVDDVALLAALGSQAEGELWLTDLAELRAAAPDCLHDLVALLAAFGVAVEEHAEGLRVRGPQPPRPARVSIGTDHHRLALAAAALALAAPGESTIEAPAAAAPSLAALAATLSALGGRARVV
jgi:3-phosphoshikimate 1-carboxyvinyltransferase